MTAQKQAVVDGEAPAVGAVLPGLNPACGTTLGIALADQRVGAQRAHHIARIANHMDEPGIGKVAQNRGETMHIARGFVHPDPTLTQGQIGALEGIDERSAAGALAQQIVHQRRIETEARRQVVGLDRHRQKQKGFRRISQLRMAAEHAAQQRGAAAAAGADRRQPRRGSVGGVICFGWLEIKGAPAAQLRLLLRRQRIGQGGGGQAAGPARIRPKLMESPQRRPRARH